MFRTMLFLFVITSAVQCKTDTGTPVKTPHGYKCVFHEYANSAKPQIGQWAVFEIDRYKDGFRSASSRLSKSFGRFKIKKEKDVKKPVHAVYDLVSMMSIGDSAVVYEQEALHASSGRLEGEIKYVVVLKYLLDDEGYKRLVSAEGDAKNKRREAIIDEGPVVKAKSQRLIQQFQEGTLTDQLVSLDNGLKYLIVEEGSGIRPREGQRISVSYYGFLADGTEFEDTFSKGRFFGFRLGQGDVIKAWDEVFKHLRQGTKLMIFAPAALAYGATGKTPNIPADADLIFYADFELVF